LRPIGWLAIAISFGGVTIIAVCDPHGLHFGFGALLTLIAAFCSAFMGFLQKPLLARYSSLAITACIMWSGALLLSPFLPSAIAVAVHGPTASTLAVAFLGIFPAAIGYLSWAFVLSRFTLSQTASMLYLIPFTTLIIAFFWLGEIPNAASLGGGAMSILGVILLTRYGRSSTAVLKVPPAEVYKS
jgi:drug/metabolite transporter (DMT)-like permease